MVVKDVVVRQCGAQPVEDGSNVAAATIEEPKRTPRWPYIAAGALLLMAVLGAAIWIKSTGSSLDSAPSIEAR
jgi:hypothetical protein